MKKLSFIKDKKYVTYAKKSFVIIKTKKASLDYTKKSEIIVITPGKFREAAHSICNLRYKVPKEIPIVFHNGSSYDCHFIMKQSAKEFKGQFEYLGENTEKYVTFSVPMKKELDNRKTRTYQLKFIDSYRFIQSKLSDLVDNLSGIFNKEYKWCIERKKIKSEWDYIGFRSNRLNYKCKECGTRFSKLISEAVRNFPITYKFCKGYHKKFALLLRRLL